MTTMITHDHKRSKMVNTSDLLFENLIPWAAFVSDMERHWSEATLRRWLREGMPKEKIQGKIFVNPVKVAAWLKGRPKK